MLTKEIFSGKTHQWFLFGRDPEKPDKIIDTNQYLIKTPNHSLLMDPGGIELFPAMLASVVKQVPTSQITHLFASHQDPDIISSLGLWDQALGGAVLHAPSIWEGFIRHFGMNTITYDPIPDQGKTIEIEGVALQFVPAHYLHASGNFHVFDPEAKILMSGDIGAALEDAESPLLVDDFDEHTKKMTYFHQRWMPSNKAKDHWIETVSKLNIQTLCPQHGRMFTGDNVKRFLEWFDNLEVGIAVDQK